MKWIKCIIAWLLLPAVWSSLHFGTLLLSQASRNLQANEWTILIAFGGGVVCWIILFFVLPRPTWVYVFGHELTHAIAVWLSFGQVHEFKIGKTGGQVVASKSSAFIALAPYLIPLYPLLAGLAWCGAVYFWPNRLMPYETYFWVFWGICWGFHFCFTASVLKTEQSDFSSQGYFFSFVIIFLCNLWMILFLIWAWRHPWTWGQGGNIFYQMVLNDYRSTGACLEKGWQMGTEFIQAKTGL